MMNAIQCNAQVGDCVKFTRQSSHDDGIGEITHSSPTKVKVKLFRSMSSAILQQYSLRSINAIDFPLAFQDNLLEVYKSSDEIYIDRSAIIDLAFIVPMAEVESGMFFLSGAENTFCIRYIFDNNELATCRPSLYFCRYMVEPLGVRVFTVLNTLSQHLRMVFSVPSWGARDRDIH
jgi:hypothetical protein